MSFAYQKEINQKTDTRFAIWKMEESVEGLLSILQLKKEETICLKAFHHPKRILHCLTTRILLQRMFHTNKVIDYQVDAYGKPFLTNSNYNISISHSGDYVAVMISKEEAVGIDIEFIRPKLETIVHKFLSPTELSFIDETHRLKHLYACWCAKEAVYKLYGKGHLSFSKDILLNPFPYTADGKIVIALNSNHAVRHLSTYFQEFNAYMVSYVME